MCDDKCTVLRFNDVAVHDCQLRRMINLTKILRTDCFAGKKLPCAYLAHHELEGMIITAINSDVIIVSAELHPAIHVNAAMVKWRGGGGGGGGRKPNGTFP